ncbi:MAG: hypothetical protein HYZ72_03010 [Deltaproteobacteria bacterium]|nr:hypothetical protein [Deltaproteobacteria bacterium]
MRRRVLSLSVVIPALTLCMSTPVLAASTHKGKVVEAGGGKLTMTDKAGKNQHAHEVPADATILCGGKKCGLEDLKAGTTITVTIDKKGDQTVVTKISEGKAQKAAQKAEK